MYRCMIAFILLLSSCSPSSLEDYQHEGEAQCHRLVQDLQKIHSREDLAKAAPDLKKGFEQIVDLIIEVRKYQQEHPEECLFDQTNFASDSLFNELKRVYSFEGGREAIEKAQREALIRLDAFDRSLKQKQSRIK